MPYPIDFSQKYEEKGEKSDLKFVYTDFLLTFML